MKLLPRNSLRLESPVRFYQNAWLIVMSAVMFISVSQFRFRDPNASLEGSADAQILVQLGLYGVLFALVLLRAFDQRLPPTFLNRPGQAPPIARAVLFFAVTFAISSLYSPTSTAVVRAFQMSTVAFAGVQAGQDFMTDPQALANFWIRFRRIVWIWVLVAIALTFALPQFQPFTPSTYVPARFRFFSGSPVEGGAVLGFALVLLVSSLVGFRDPWWNESKNRERMAYGLVAVLALFLALTKSRGALAGTAVAMAVVLGHIQSKTMRRWIVLGGSLGLPLLLAGAFDQLIVQIILREQDAEKLATLTDRTNLFAEISILFAERPIFGHGYQSSRSLLLDKVFGAGHAHNLWYEAALALGIVGVLIVVLVLLALGVGVFGIRNRGIRADAMAMVGSMLMTGIIDDGFAGAPQLEINQLALCTILIMSRAPRDLSPQPSVSETESESELRPTSASRGGPVRARGA